jgi:hypothetical protein
MKHGLTKITEQIICGFRMMGLMPPKIPSGKGKRLIVLYAGTRSEGLIDGCDLVFLAKSKDGDYHQMNIITPIIDNRHLIVQNSSIITYFFYKYIQDQ